MCKSDGFVFVSGGFASWSEVSGGGDLVRNFWENLRWELGLGVVRLVQMRFEDSPNIGKLELVEVGSRFVAR